MKIFGIILKILLSVLAGTYMITGGGVIYAVVCGGILYGILSFCAWYLKKKGFSFTVWVGEKGLFMTLLSVALALFVPLIILSLFVTVLNSILPVIGMYIASIIIVIMCFVFILKDVEAIVQIFNPSFKIFKSKDVENGEGERI